MSVVGLTGLAACSPESSDEAASAAGSTVSSELGGRGATAGSSMTSSGSGGAHAGAAGSGKVQQPGPGPAGNSGRTGMASTAGGTGGTAADGGNAAPAAGMGAPTGGAGSSGKSGSGNMASAGASAGTSDGAEGETGRMVGMTAAHNAVRARIMNPTPMPALPPLKWSSQIAEIAQAYADKLASGGNCLNLVHSMREGYGENLAGYMGLMAKPMDVVEGWAAEEECLKFGPITRDGSECDMTCARSKQSNGCGHYTQVVWRGTTEVGCGVATCGSGRQAGEVWVCNYRAPGNYIGQKPY